jgi:ribosome-associated translation inhibitor RaiA/cold shock CspA family protein
MQIPSKILFHNTDYSAALESRIQEKIDKLSLRFPDLIRCQVTVEPCPHHRQNGNNYSVHILATLPGTEKAASHHSDKVSSRHDQVFTAMNEAFKAIEKQLKHYKQYQRGMQKNHSSVLLDGKVIGLDVGQEYGFVALADGTEFYFHKNAVESGRFLELEKGHKVRFSFIEGEGTQGPQANFVKIMGKKVKG